MSYCVRGVLGVRGASSSSELLHKKELGDEEEELEVRKMEDPAESLRTAHDMGAKVAGVHDGQSSRANR